MEHTRGTNQFAYSCLVYCQENTVAHYPEPHYLDTASAKANSPSQTMFVLLSVVTLGALTVVAKLPFFVSHLRVRFDEIVQDLPLGNSLIIFSSKMGTLVNDS